VRVGGAVPEGGRRRGCDGGGDLLLTTRGSRQGETRVGAALNMVESGRGVGAFYRAGEEGGSRSEELDGGWGVRFEVGRFEDEGDMVRRWFIGQKEGGRAALRFGSLCAEEGAASSGARCGKADWAGGGGSGGGRR
jgi:hypothetical protein